MSPIRFNQRSRSPFRLPSLFLPSSFFLPPPPVDIQQDARYIPVGNQQEATRWPEQGDNVTTPKSDVLQGTLDLMVLKTLDTLGAMHGYGIAQRIQQVSSQMLQLNQGTLYPALLRLEQRGWISSRWGTSENNRRAKYYSLTRAGRKQLAREAADWQRIVDVMGRLLAGEGTP
jgi:transcriptional regulator